MVTRPRQGADGPARYESSRHEGASTTLHKIILLTLKSSHVIAEGFNCMSRASIEEKTKQPKSSPASGARGRAEILP